MAGAAPSWRPPISPTLSLWTHFPSLPTLLPCSYHHPKNRTLDLFIIFCQREGYGKAGACLSGALV